MKKIKIDDFAHIKYISNPTFSPDGKTIAYVVSNANLEKNSYESYIYIKKDNKDFKLTNGGKENNFFFLDNDTILFSSDRSDSKANGSKYYEININGGEASLKFEFPIDVYKMHKLDNGNFLLIGSFNPKWPLIFEGKEEYIKKYKEAQKEDEDYEVMEENPWWWNGSTFTRGIKNALYLYNTKKNKLELISNKNLNVSNFFISSDESYIYFSASKNAPKLEFGTDDIYELNLNNNKAKEIINHKDLNVGEICFLNKEIIILGNKNEFGMNTNFDFYRFDPKSKEITLAQTFGEAIGSTVGSDVRLGGGNVIKVVDDTIYFITTIYDNAYLYSYKNGEIKCVINKEGSIDSFDIYKDKLVMVSLYDMKPQELYNESLNQITKINSKYVKGANIIKPEQFEFKGVNDILHGFVIKPVNYEEGKKYPAILDIHGGPKTVYGPVYYHEMQYWANEGYFVVYTNPTGSDGRGNKFADIRGKYGAIDYQDLMLFVDEVINRYKDIDSNNFFETGGSYGGFMTNWIIGHTNRFKACASQRSIANWFSFYGISDIGIGFSRDQQASDPFTSPEALWDKSPMKYASKCTTPTLFIHSECDYRCPVAEGFQMYTSLIDNNVETRLVYFKGENHDLSRTGKPKHRIRRLKEITSWFNKHNN